MGSVSVVNTFSLRDGVTSAEFDAFSRELDRPTCLAFEPVESFEVYLVNSQGRSAIDVIEVMTVTSWAAWEAVRDGAEEMKPVVRRFDELVETSTVHTYITQRSADRP